MSELRPLTHMHSYPAKFRKISRMGSIFQEIRTVNLPVQVLPVPAICWIVSGPGPIYSGTAMCQKGCKTENSQNPDACVNSVNH